MNIVVSDDQVIINLMGIRYVNWGETSSIYHGGNSKPWFLTVTYKGNHQTFYYRTETEVRSMFNKLREAMDKTAKHA